MKAKVDVVRVAQAERDTDLSDDNLKDTPDLLAKMKEESVAVLPPRSQWTPTRRRKVVRRHSPNPRTTLSRASALPFRTLHSIRVQVSVPGNNKLTVVLRFRSDACVSSKIERDGAGQGQ